MAETILTLSQALDRATSGQVIAPDSKRQAQVLASMSLATNTLALQRAMKATKHQLQAQGLRVTHFSPRDLVIRAEAYLAEHRAELSPKQGRSLITGKPQACSESEEAFISSVQDLQLLHNSRLLERQWFLMCYALFTLVGIAGEDDIDAPDLEAPTPPASAAAKPTPARHGRLNDGQSIGRGRIIVSNPARMILDAEATATLRGQLMGEVKEIASSDDAAVWAHRILAASSTCLASASVRLFLAQCQRMPRPLTRAG